MNLLVMPEGIQVKKSFGKGGTCQPHPQLVPVHMSAHDSLGSGHSLTAHLNLAFVNPHIQAKGYHAVGDGYLQGLGDSQGGSLLCQYASLCCRSGGFGFDLPRLLRGVA